MLAVITNVNVFLPDMFNWPFAMMKNLTNFSLVSPLLLVVFYPTSTLFSYPRRNQAKKRMLLKPRKPKRPNHHPKSRKKRNQRKVARKAARKETKLLRPPLKVEPKLLLKRDTIVHDQWKIITVLSAPPLYLLIGSNEILVCSTRTVDQAFVFLEGWSVVKGRILPLGDLHSH